MIRVTGSFPLPMVLTSRSKSFVSLSSLERASFSCSRLSSWREPTMTRLSELRIHLIHILCLVLLRRRCPAVEEDISKGTNGVSLLNSGFKDFSCKVTFPLLCFLAFVAFHP